MRNGADHASMFPDSVNFSPKNAMAKSVPNIPMASDVGIAKAEKYFEKNLRIDSILDSSALPANHEMTGNRNPMSGVMSRNGIPMRLR